MARCEEQAAGGPVDDAFGRRALLRVLIVEDNRDSRETLRVLLELLGYQVAVAEDGLTGVKKAISWRPGVALIDVGLPGLDGYQVANALRAALGAEIFLVAHTGYGQPDDRRRALEAGFDAHLTKPVDWLELEHWLLEVASVSPDDGFLLAGEEAC